MYFRIYSKNSIYEDNFLTFLKHMRKSLLTMTLPLKLSLKFLVSIDAGNLVCCTQKYIENIAMKFLKWLLEQFSNS
jgi:hypothetical protein